MFDIEESLAAEHETVLAALPVPMPPACIRSLIAASTHDHRYAESHRKSSHALRARRHTGRAARLSRSADVAQDRAAELLAEVR